MALMGWRLESPGSRVGLISVSFSLHQVAAGFLAAALAGCCLGFLRHNFNPARIFMGDGGSYFLGFTLAAVSIVGPAKGLTTVSLLLPLLILSLPLADMSAVIMGRLAKGVRHSIPIDAICITACCGQVSVTDARCC